MQLIGWCELGISLGSYRPIFVDALVIVVENEISIDNPLFPTLIDTSYTVPVKNF